jgi:hypothetical protein
VGVRRGQGGVPDRWTVPPGVPQVCQSVPKCARLAHLRRLVSSVKVKSLAVLEARGEREKGKVEVVKAETGAWRRAWYRAKRLAALPCMKSQQRTTGRKLNPCQPWGE